MPARAYRSPHDLHAAFGELKDAERVDPDSRLLSMGGSGHYFQVHRDRAEKVAQVFRTLGGQRDL